MKFEKRTPIIDAFRVGMDTIPEWFNNWIKLDKASLNENAEGVTSAKISVDGYGQLCANRGDWVVNDGNLIYVCKQWLFDKIYKSAGE